MSNFNKGRCAGWAQSGRSMSGPHQALTLFLPARGVGFPSPTAICPIHANWRCFMNDVSNKCCAGCIQFHAIRLSNWLRFNALSNLVRSMMVFRTRSGVGIIVRECDKLLFRAYNWLPKEYVHAHEHEKNIAEVRKVLGEFLCF